MTKKSILRTIFHKNKLRFVTQIAVSTIVAGLNVFSAILLKKIIDIATSGTIPELKNLLIVSGTYILTLLGVSFVCTFLKNTYIRKGMQNLKADIMEQILTGDINMMKRNTTSRYFTVFSSSVASIETDYIENLLVMIQNVITAVLGVIVMIYLDISLFLCVLIVGGLTFSLSGLFMKNASDTEKRVMKSNEQFVTFAKEILSGFQIIKSFQAERTVLDIFDKKSNELESGKYKKRMLHDAIKVSGEMSTNCIVLFVFAVGAWQAIHGTITAGTIVAFIQLMNFIVVPIQVIPQCVAKFKAVRAVTENLEELTESGDEQRYEEQDIQGYNIAFHHVDFSYDGTEKALTDITISFDENKKYAIVGPSGSGKSTLIQLLQGYWNQYDGTMSLGGVDIRGISNKEIFSHISVLQQEIIIFDTSIWNNITLYKEFTKEQVERVVDAANLRELVTEKGLQYECGENGNKLSGGERQRIAIARCLLLNVPIMLMDEATSALDSNTAYEIEKTILNLESKTRIVVTHKYNKELLKEYDEIIVMKKGVIAERGTFDELIDKKAEFWRLYSLAE